MDDANRPTRVPPMRQDEPRMMRPETSGNVIEDGYWVRVRRPRLAGYFDLVEPERADRIEGFVSEFEAPSMDYDD